MSGGTIGEPIFSRGSWAIHAKLITVTECDEGGFHILVSCHEENIYSNNYVVSGVEDLTHRLTKHGNIRLTMPGGGTQPVVTPEAFEDLKQALV